ncbi:DNA-binding protein [Saccharolobus solfataricus]|uniref:DNA-binding protein SSO0352 n=3 Tax=Saccharolobus solfataricus TaxID=2287 RepID=Y352_SACS2|nr:DNA-binding protein [Saccharolobus solfataricus]Q980F8.1 RecName: Full=DNA-binding protein SSO0352 [Saccharolobus solfataricus P2]6IQC_A Chain A, DNA-binding protein SSO0352 [Saccharolobus solfataricus P2]AAK40684.1 Apoptosis-related Tfar19 related protein (pdcd5) [Saccharolobus solfataricus P2]AKA73660.1 DNA-binding protein [Saccharolobus solfataricus]AKA76357.1 DNA-binding protein [Saccharolobus solfataricus]AKA79049.1 DNA-binding protein [Saccharolobus solfataricus]AZF68129.1 DNA-bindi
MSTPNSYDDEELEELLRRKAAQEQKRIEEERKRKAELESQKESILRVILTPEARQRLTNIKLVKPEFAESLENQLIALAQSGRIKIPITDEELKQILEQISQQNRRDFKIQIRERGWK